MNRVGRAVLALTFVIALASPAQAKPTEEGWSPSRVMKAVKRLTVKMLGDGVIIPRP